MRSLLATVFPYTTLFRSRCGRSRHLARKLSLRRKRSSPNVFEMAATETITSIILIKTFGLLRFLLRSEERFSRNAETELVCRLLLGKEICLPPRVLQYHMTTTFSRVVFGYYL